jgi:RNA polymerase sigma factor (sigma-70 family)
MTSTDSGAGVLRPRKPPQRDLDTGPPPGAGDAALVAASLQEPELFSLVYERHANAMYRFAYRRLGPDLAQDAVSDAILEAFRFRHRYDQERADARPWLLGILTHQISQHRRAERSRYRTLSRAAASADVQDTLLDPVAGQVTAQTVRAPLAAALRQLADRDRDVLLLVAWADLSYQEVAHALAIPVGTVRSRLNRARRVLRQALPDLHLLLDDEESR